MEFLASVITSSIPPYFFTICLRIVDPDTGEEVMEKFCDGVHGNVMRVLEEFARRRSLRIVEDNQVKIGNTLIQFYLVEEQ